MKTNRTIIILAVSLVIIGIIFSPIKVPYTIRGVAKILPARQMIISRGNSGEILTTTKNNINGIDYCSRLYSFERGESIILDIDPSLENGQTVVKGDTLGSIYSSSRQENLIKLNGELQVLKATLKANKSGDKKTIVREARERLAQATAELEKQEKIVTILKALYEKKLVAETEYQTAMDELNVLSKSVNVRKAELASSLSGQKDEEINMLQEQIVAAENELAFLRRQIDSQNIIIAPFSGRIERSFSSDTLFFLSKTDSAIACIPVALEQAAYIYMGEKASFYSSGTNNLVSGHIIMKQPVMKLIDGKQCILVLATVENLSINFISGIISQVKISCRPVSLQTFIKRNILQ